MPSGGLVMSDRDVASIYSTINRKDSQIDALKNKAQGAAVKNAGLAMIEAWGGAAAFGYVRGQYEDKTTGALNVPNTTVDIQLMVVLGLAAVALGGAYVKQLKPFSTHAAFVAAGIGGHYSGQVARKAGRTGSFTMIAGVPGIGTLPQYDPHSYDPTQFSAPYSDPVASSLASSGV